MKRTFAAGVLASFVLAQGCAVHLEPRRPMQRHLRPMLHGPVAVLQPKVCTEDGEVYISDAGCILWTHRRPVKSYGQVLAQSIAAAIEGTGVAPSAKAVSAPAANLRAWVNSREAEGFRYVLVPEVNHWACACGSERISHPPNPIPLLGFLGFHVWMCYLEASCGLTVQVCDMRTGKTIIMFNPRCDYSRRFVPGGLFSVEQLLKDAMQEFHDRLVNVFREELEARALLYAVDGSVVPYGWRIQAR